MARGVNSERRALFHDKMEYDIWYHIKTNSCARVMLYLNINYLREAVRLSNAV